MCCHITSRRHGASASAIAYRFMPLCGADDACVVPSYIEHVGCRLMWYNHLPLLSGA
jgi:hypothetical protein